MYNIYSHNENILNLAKSIITECSLMYLHPFGSTQPENVEIIGGNDNGPMVVIYDQEPLDLFYNTPLFNYIHDIHRDLQGEFRPMILLSTERRSQEKEKILQRYNAIDVNYFFHAFCASDWYRGYRYNTGITSPAKRKLQKKFISFNRITGSMRAYRSLLIAELANVIDQGYVSYSHTCPVHNETVRDALVNNNKKFKLSRSYIETMASKIDSLPSPLRIDSSEADIPNGSQSIGPLPELMSSFLHVVTETMFWDDRTHLTEKIFKPIVAKQPFVLVGCYKNLEYLKSYGFRTFDRWWNEDYDNIADPVQRLNAVSNIVKTICEKSLLDLESMLQDMTEVLEYNYNLFYSTGFLDKAWAELESSFEKVNDKLVAWTRPNIGMPCPQVSRNERLEIRQNTSSYEEELKAIAELESQILSKT